MYRTYSIPNIFRAATKYRTRLRRLQGVGYRGLVSLGDINDGKFSIRSRLGSEAEFFGEKSTLALPGRHIYQPLLLMLRFVDAIVVHGQMIFILTSTFILVEGAR